MESKLKLNLKKYICALFIYLFLNIQFPRYRLELKRTYKSILFFNSIIIVNINREIIYI